MNRHAQPRLDRNSIDAHNKSLDRSGGSVFRIKLGAAKVALIRAARSTQTLGVATFAHNRLSYTVMNSFKTIAGAVSLMICVAATLGFKSDAPSVHLDGHAKGIVLNLVCEPIPKAQITFSNKRKMQVVSPETDGHFVVALPTGDYDISVTIPGRAEIKPNEVFVQRARNGEIRVLVNTGVESTCGCFDDIEDHLIPIEPMTINTQILKRKPSPTP
jgi:hypothetical protein